jgi:hypothetical protein
MQLSISAETCSYKRVSSGYKRVSSGYKCVSSGYKRVSNGYKRVSSGYKRVSSGYKRVCSGYKRVCSALDIPIPVRALSSHELLPAHVLLGPCPWQEVDEGWSQGRRTATISSMEHCTWGSCSGGEWSSNRTTRKSIEDN